MELALEDVAHFRGYCIQASMTLIWPYQRGILVSCTGFNGVGN